MLSGLGVSVLCFHARAVYLPLSVSLVSGIVLVDYPVVIYAVESRRLVLLSFMLWEERVRLAGELLTGGLDTDIKGRAR